MTKNELIAAVADHTSLPRAAAANAVEATFEVIASTLGKGGEVKIAGFGNFKVSRRAQREGRDPRSGQPVTIPASNRPKFSAGKALKEACNR